MRYLRETRPERALLGGASCAAGRSLIEASLEHAPYTTYTMSFTVEAPAPGLAE